MKDWAVAFAAAALVVGFIVYCITVLLWAYAT